ncbi:srab-14 [Pristionchus pacificus]|uniref:Srab-14 n=1 Tax=Pristionchus pacificus TaxID=54126 RepID=A0A2A6CYF5_PRIPA|nr:srab-14 [Pristionchus pacificus]|eukprot:PDM83205.1 srab-14 [Pristionchus pacificus]
MTSFSVFPSAYSNVVSGFRKGASGRFEMLSIKGMFDSIAISNYTEQDCDNSYNTATAPEMQTLRIVHVFFTCSGLLACSLFIYVLQHRSSSNLHINLRLSLTSLSIAAIIACAQLLFIAIYNFIRTISMDDKCNAIIDAKTCAVIRWPVVLAIYATLAGIICLAIERTIATIRYRSYETHGSRKVSLLLIAAQWIISLAISFTSLFLRADDGFLLYCTVYISHPKSAVVSLSIMNVLELFILLFFASLLQINRRNQVREFVNCARHTLTERYQLIENIRMIHILIPSVMVHAALSLFGLGTLLAFALIETEMTADSIGRFAPFSELVLLIVPIYSVVFTLVAVGWNKPLRNAARCALPCLFTASEEERSMRVEPPLLTSRDSAEMQQDSDRHFGLLDKMWAK